MAEVPTVMFFKFEKVSMIKPAAPVREMLPFRVQAAQ
jgi:hypothetical protein